MAVYTSIDNPELYFQTKTYTGTEDELAITLDGDENMQPDFVWIKRRATSQNHFIFDSVRGATKYINSNTTDQEYTQAQGLKSFDTDGFTLGTWDGPNDDVTNVAWCWKESATAGFDILTFEGNGTDDTDISHNLSAVPHWMVVRNFDAAKDWCVYHHKNTSAPETDLLVLNTNAATTDTDDRWSDEAPTSSVFTVGDSSQLNASGNTSIAYLWSEKQGFSKFGSWTGYGNADGNFIYTGFRPAWVMIKKTNSSGSVNWYIFDNKRSPVNAVDDFLKADTNDAEGGDGNGYLDFLSNGFKFKTTNIGTESSGTFIYMSFAEQPFVNSKGVPANAR